MRTLAPMVEPITSLRLRRGFEAVHRIEGDAAGEVSGVVEKVLLGWGQ